MPTLTKNSRSPNILVGSHIALLLMFISFSLSGQDNCSGKLLEAQQLYDQGLIEEIPQMLTPCIEEGFTRAQKIEAYKLIVLSYLFDNDQFEAERTMVEFLTKYPEYELMPNDPVEFVYLFESYRTTSVFSIGLSAGMNMSDPRIIEPFSVFDMTVTERKSNLKSGFHVGFGMARYISRRMLFNFELIFGQNRYSFTDRMSFSRSDNVQTISEASYLERYNRVELPVSFTWDVITGKMNYFIRAGFAVASTIQVKGQASYRPEEDMTLNTSETVKMNDYRNKWLYGAIAGAGMRYKVPRGFILVDLRANIGLNNLVKEGTRYDNTLFSSKYYYLDDDFSLNTFMLTAGYYFSFYTPSKQR